MALEIAKKVTIEFKDKIVSSEGIPVLLVNTLAKDDNDKTFSIKYLTVTIPLDENANT